MIKLSEYGLSLNEGIPVSKGDNFGRWFNTKTFLNIGLSWDTPEEELHWEYVPTGLRYYSLLHWYEVRDFEIQWTSKELPQTMYPFPIYLKKGYVKIKGKWICKFQTFTT